jgi:hypothetical protein
MSFLHRNSKVQLRAASCLVFSRTRAGPTIGYGIAAWFISIVHLHRHHGGDHVGSAGWVMNLVNHVSPPEQTTPK